MPNVNIKAKGMLTCYTHNIDKDKKIYLLKGITMGVPMDAH